MLGFLIIGYGSCSACDQLESALENRGDGWDSVIVLSDNLRRRIHWENSKEGLMEWAAKNPENHWWVYQEEIVQWLNDHVARL